MVYIRQRVEGFMARAGLCEEVSVRTLQNNQDSSLKAIVDYVKHALASDDAYFGIVPTAWVITGAVGFDSAVTFSLLLDRLQDSKRTFIAPVSSADASTPGKLFKAFARSLLVRFYPHSVSCNVKELSIHFFGLLEHE